MISFPPRGLRAVASADKFLLLALAAVLLSGIHGLTWGRYGCLNPDEMTGRGIKSSPPLHPGRFDKPPLLPYINKIFINEPTRTVAGWAISAGADKQHANSLRRQWRTALSRLLQTGFYAGIVIFSFLFARQWFGLASARVTALLLGTCAGFVPFKIFLTADISLVFWMTACLYMAGRIMRDPDSVRISLLAGIFAGLATATKDNGLGIAIVLPLAHFLAPGGWAAAWRRRAFYLCGLAVPAAFIVANPYCLLDGRQFAEDFMYNYTVTPVYGGETGSGYSLFLSHLPAIFGQPLTWLFPVVMLAGLWLLRSPDNGGMRRAMILLAAPVLLYYWKIGGFPRMETRFVLPVAPLLLLLAAPGWQALARRPGLLIAIVAPLCLYGLVSGWFVGNIFADDARMQALSWAQRNLPRQAVIETAGHCPDWESLEDRKVKTRSFPHGLARNLMFQQTLGKNPWVVGRLSRHLGRDDQDFLTPEALRLRNPDYITVDSYYLQDSAARSFVQKLIAGELGYQVVFEAETPAPPVWIYPQHPDFTRGKFWILARE